jgi:hypothetical protein
MRSDDVLKDFYEKVPLEEVEFYKKLVEVAIGLGYKPKKESKKYGFSISLNNRKLKNTIIMLYYSEKEGTFWKFKFYSNKNYINVFDDMLKKLFEKYNNASKYKNGPCIDNNCGLCKDVKRGYNIEYNDGSKYFLCGFYLIPIYKISEKIVEEAVKMMKIQHKAFMEDIGQE